MVKTGSRPEFIATAAVQRKKVLAFTTFKNSIIWANAK